MHRCSAHKGTSSKRFCFPRLLGVDSFLQLIGIDEGGANYDFALDRIDRAKMRNQKLEKYL